MSKIRNYEITCVHFSLYNIGNKEDFGYSAHYESYIYAKVC